MSVQPYDVADIRRFIEALDDLAASVCLPPIRLGMHPCETKEEAAAYMAEHARLSGATDVWMVIADTLSTHTETGEIDHAVCTAITGNGALSEVHARLYTLLHENVPFVRWLAMRQLATLEGWTDD